MEEVNLRLDSVTSIMLKYDDYSDVEEVNQQVISVTRYCQNMMLTV